MIGPSGGEVPKLLREYELGEVPPEIAHEQVVAEHHGQNDERAKKARKDARWRWLRFLRRH